MTLRRVLLILTMTAPLFAHAEGGVLGLIKKVGARIDSMTIRGVDRRYIEIPEKPWQVMLKGNVNRSELNMDAMFDDKRLLQDGSGNINWAPRFSTPVSTYVGLWAGYRGHGIGYSRNISGGDGRDFNLGSISSSYGVSLNIHSFSTKKPTVDMSGYKSDQEERTFDYELNDPMRVRLLTLDGYYLFNSKRCSYTAAFEQSVIQRRSSGSLMVGGMYYHSTIDYAEGHNGDFIYFMNDIGKMKHYQLSLGGGYAYNWVPCKGLLVTGLGMVLMTVYNRLDVWRYNSLLRQMILEKEKPETGTQNSNAISEMSQDEIKQAAKDFIAIWPMENGAYERQYSRIKPVIDARLSVTYNVGNLFFNANAQLYHFSFRYEENQGRLVDWHINASGGIRF